MLLNRYVQCLEVGPPSVYGKHVLNQFSGHHERCPVLVAASQLFFMKQRQFLVPIRHKFSGLDQLCLQVFVALFGYGSALFFACRFVLCAA